MTDEQALCGTNGSSLPATVARVLSEYRVVINRGSLQGIEKGQRFLLYALSEEDIVDPTTGEPLGHLEIVKGTGKVVHVQERLATIESDMTRGPGGTVVRRVPLSGGFMAHYLSSWEEVRSASPPESIPFDEPAVNDKAKPI